MSFLDFLFPRRCLDCGRGGNYFCPSCQEEISIPEKQICPVCQKPAIHGLTHPKCQTKYSLDGLTSIFSYQGIIKKAVTRLKYKFITDLARELTELCVEPLPNLQLSNLNHQSQILVPIPLHPYRKRQRGFNQAELLGEILAKKFNWQFQADVLKRIRYTKPQVKLKKEARGKNIRGAFAINQKYLYQFARPASKDFREENDSAGQNSDKFVWRLESSTRNVLVFDDVWTTGATLREAGNVLKRTGLKKVYGLTLAR